MALHVWAPSGPVLPPFATARARSTHLHGTSVYPSLSAHTNTGVRPPRLEGNREKATLCSQTAQCDHSGAPLTPMQQPLPPEPSVCVHVYAFVKLPSFNRKSMERYSLFSSYPPSPGRVDSQPKVRWSTHAAR